jgi:hypothetical protein
MPIVELDDGTEVEFPDDMSGDEIKAVLDKQYGKAALVEATESSFLDNVLSIPEDISAVTSERIVQPAMRAMGMNPKANTPEVITRSKGSYPASIANAGEDIITGTLQLADYLNPSSVLSNIYEDVSSLTGMSKPDKSLKPGDRGYLAQAIRDRTKNRREESEKARLEIGRGSFDPVELAAGLAVPGIGGAGKADKLWDFVKQGAKIGALNAAIMPTTDENIGLGKAKQIGAGALVGGAIPLAVKPVSWLAEQAEQVIRPFSKKGITKDIRDLLISELGPERAKVAEAMMLASDDMTASQALAKMTQETGDIAGAPIMKLENELSKKGGEGAPLRSQYNQQQNAREDIINEIAGLPTKRRLADEFSDADLPVSLRSNNEPGLDDFVNKQNPDESFIPSMTKQQAGGTRLQEAENIADPLERAIAIRNIKSGELYSKAYSQPLKIEQGDKEFTAIIENPFFKKALPLARDLSSAKKVTFKDNPTEYLHNIKLALDDMLKTEGKTALGSSEKRAINDVKSQLVKFIEDKNPLYKEARLEFQNISKPINQMEVGRLLSEKLVNPSGNEAPGTFLRAAKDATGTLKKSTGFSRYNELGDVMNPEQVSGIEKVISELERQAISNKGAGQVSSVLPKLESGIEISLPNLLSRPALVANAVLRTIGRNKSPEYNKVATEIMQNPKKLADLLKSPETSGIANQVYAEITKIIGQASGREIGNLEAVE